MRPFLERVLLFSFALKWFWPALRARILPFLVTLKRLRYDLFVLIDMVVALFSLYDGGQSFGTFERCLSDFVFDGDKFEDSLEAFFEEIEFHVLGTAYEE